MNEHLMRYYSEELNYIREMSLEFAEAYPNNAASLGLGSATCDDPYVERLLEGFAFLAARTRLKLDAGFPQMAQHLFELLFPGFTAPNPSVCIVELEPEAGMLQSSFKLPAKTQLQGQYSKDSSARCLFRTCFDVVLTPLVIAEVDYRNRDLLASPNSGIGNGASKHRAELRITLSLPDKISVSELELDALSFYLPNFDGLGSALFEALNCNLSEVRIADTSQLPKSTQLTKARLVADGFADNQAMFESCQRQFGGLRLLQEYFAYREKFQFVKLTGLSDWGDFTSNQITLIFVLSKVDERLVGALNNEYIRLHATPAVNLFEKRLSPYKLDPKRMASPLVVDPANQADYEIIRLLEVDALFEQDTGRETVRPFGHWQGSSSLTYSTERRQRLISKRKQTTGARAPYLGSDVFINLIDNDQKQLSHVRQLSLTALCSNGDLPLNMPLSRGKTDFSLLTGAPVKSIRAKQGVSQPASAIFDARTPWMLTTLLGFSLGSLVGDNGAAHLKQLLTLLAPKNGRIEQRLLEGIVQVGADPLIERVPSKGPVCFARGLKVSIELDENYFDNGDAFALGSLLEKVLRHYISANSLLQVALSTLQRGEVHCWPVRFGGAPRL
ncbi:type VI secretion system baseplate subunit TssF [Paraferrimonas sedimenticola]|uniref:Type VI secretion system protein ImpG n=1 Tax=Paraferrimonas sedimenticola TaxID=375674 RepID=A0AA37RY37_9GAMM|nr:type VI secretion system baseplate subunit TssF [Paraferrimonas sedimenticola]GLP96842.1 hypothetical protein GCM10007895_21480 [Paraferrimonas sedimenticola]